MKSVLSIAENSINNLIYIDEKVIDLVYGSLQLERLLFEFDYRAGARQEQRHPGHEINLSELTVNFFIKIKKSTQEKFNFI